jgi:AcrR family transcriptional regulator
LTLKYVAAMLTRHDDSKAAKLAALLDEAAQEFNARGLAGASIGRIARAMGLTRAAVYYYVKDREDLAVQCYRRWGPPPRLAARVSTDCSLSCACRSIRNAPHRPS